MANPEHVEIVRAGADAIQQWRENNLDEILDLSEANLIEANLSEADLSGADLSEANLSVANLDWANLNGANLNGANLNVANLDWANLNGANLEGAHVSEADLAEASCFATIFANVDLSCAKGLDKVIHRGPSSIGIDTLYKSKGKIPEVFLRDAGVPDNLITYIPSLVGTLEPIQFYSCFISYSHKDEEFCKRIHSRMRDEHLRVWFAPEDMEGGKKIHEQIDSAIRVHDKLLLVLSKTSMASKWVAIEIKRARKREVEENRQVLFPIRLVPIKKLDDWKLFDRDTVTDLAAEIREYHIPDFSNWKDHDAFKEAFDRLLDNLKAAETGSK